MLLAVYHMSFLKRKALGKFGEQFSSVPKCLLIYLQVFLKFVTNKRVKLAVSHKFYEVY